MGNIGTESLDLLTTELGIELVTEDYLPSTANVATVMVSIRRAAGLIASKIGSGSALLRRAPLTVLVRRSKPISGDD